MMIDPRRPEDVVDGPDGLPSISWLEKAIAGAVIGIAFIAVLDAARVFALDRPTRDQVEALPVWGVELCLAEPTADHRQCWYLTPRDLDQANCLPIERAAAARFKGARHVRCLPDNERVTRILGAVVFVEPWRP